MNLRNLDPSNERSVLIFVEYSPFHGLFHPLSRRFRVNHSSTRFKKRSKKPSTRNPFQPPFRAGLHPHLHTDFTLVMGGGVPGVRPNIYEDVTVILISGLELISVPFSGSGRGAEVRI